MNIFFVNYLKSLKYRITKTNHINNIISQLLHILTTLNVTKQMVDRKPRHFYSYSYHTGLVKTTSILLNKLFIFFQELEKNGIMKWHQVAFILFLTSQLTVHNIHLCVLDTTLRTLITWYKLYVRLLYNTLIQIVFLYLKYK